MKTMQLEVPITCKITIEVDDKPTDTEIIYALSTMIDIYNPGKLEFFFEGSSFINEIQGSIFY